VNIPEFSVERYNQIRDEVRQSHADSWAETISLCAAVPDEIRPEHVWEFGRDKPCWSNIKVDIARKISDDVNRSDAFDSYSTIASDEWGISMLAKGPGWKSGKNFSLDGQSIKEFFLSLPEGGLRSYKWRMFAIRNFAIALRDNQRVRSMVEGLAVHGAIAPENLKNWTKEFAQCVGRGWGPVTVYHMLTDLGLAPKPDIHLRRSAIRMGLLSPNVPSDIPEDAITTKFDHKVVLAVIRLSEQITPAAYPQVPRTALREVDKVLMEWSRKGMVRSL
jgi:hypothetical protein